MKYIKFDNDLQASRSFALEELIMTNTDFQDEYFIFWRNNPTLMVGRFQNTIQEINLDFANSNNISIVRRNSGGGAIFTDLGSWQFSFITWKEKGNIKDFRSFTKPIIDALSAMGINATFSGRNDLMLFDKKFSGNAQFSIGNRHLHHGSILFDSNFELLIKSLNVNDEKIISKGIKSIKERVINIKYFLTNPNINDEDFKKQMINFVCKEMETITIDNKYIDEIDEIENNKFLNWNWNYGKSPQFNISNSKQFQGGKIEINLLVKDGIICECRITGDFFFMGDIGEFQNSLIGCKYDRTEIQNKLLANKATDLFHLITLNELLELF